MSRKNPLWERYKTQKQCEEDAPFTRCCEWEGCAVAAEYRAPKVHTKQRQSSRFGDADADYHWLCLEHVRAFNAAWDFFEGKPPEEIAAFQYEAATGHRPLRDTTPRNDHRHMPPKSLLGWRAAVEAYLYGFLKQDAGSFESAPGSGPVTSPPLPEGERQALEILELPAEPIRFSCVKKQYKVLVKRYHPDMNPENPAAAEHFRRINEAYELLSESRALVDE